MFLPHSCSYRQTPQSIKKSQGRKQLQFEVPLHRFGEVKAGTRSAGNLTSMVQSR